ncbi:hypothetical protein [Streptomyces sp. NPDC059909]|uniref:hypothetical protein n=1 Tax=Streptomyces sp. NPDC059909 TaxID=3346998 RepID=UPI00365E9B92
MGTGPTPLPYNANSGGARKRVDGLAARATGRTAASSHPPLDRPIRPVHSTRRRDEQ